MARLKILTFPDPRLRKVASPVEEFDKSLIKITENMLETMYEENGIGSVSYTHLTLPTKA